MRRRDAVAALAAGAVVAGGGCLAQAMEVAECAPTSRFGVLVENHRNSPLSMRVEVETGLLGRTVYADAFEVPAAADPPGRQYHPEIVYVPDILENLRSYSASVRLDNERSTYSWRVRCRHLSIQIHREGFASPSFSTLNSDRWERLTEDQ